MRRPWSRALSALFALWFALLAVEPGPLGSCPMHGGRVPAPADVAATVDVGPGDHHDIPVHDGHAAAVPERQDDASHCCTCLGDCAGSISGAALPARPAATGLRSVAAT